jgi:hypothetical protein
VGRPDASCQVCHTPIEGATAGGTGQSIAAVIPHEIEGKEQCSQCHGGDSSLVPMPANHPGPVSDSTCLLCHQPAAGQAADAATPEAGATPETETTQQTSGPAAIPHPIEGETYQDCTTCHGLDKVKPFPENHVAFPADTCTGCHQPAGSAEAEPGTATPEAQATPEASGTTPADATPAATAQPEATREPAPAGGAQPIPHSIVEAAYQDCTVCHGPGAVRPFPESHEAFPLSVCAGCHQPQQEQ